MKKRILIMALAAILVGCCIGGTMAYYTNQNTATNVITSGSIEVDLLEWADADREVPFEDVEGIMPGQDVTKIVEVQNVGLNEAWVRIQVIKTAQGENVPEGADLPISLDIGDKWIPAEDGWYYYTDKLAPGELSQPLFTTVSFDKTMDNPWQSAEFVIDILMQATQVANNGTSALDAAGWPDIA